MNDPLKNNSIYFNIIKPKEQKYASEMHPVPTASDITSGFYIRYFVSRKNITDAILEIDEKQYNFFISSPFYNAFSVKWVLPENTSENMNINMTTIEFVDKAYPGFKIKMRPFATPPAKYILP